MNNFQKYIYDEEKKWFVRMEPFLYGKILKVGNGLGYLSDLVEAKSKEFKVIDVQINKLAKNKNRVALYNGNDFPFKDKSFDCVVCSYVLHHTENPIKVLGEMKRVGKRLIILEETYENIFSKIDLVYRDIYVNFFADQPSKIHWNNYFRRAKVEKIFLKDGFKTVSHYKERKRRYWKELFVLEH